MIEAFGGRGEIWKRCYRDYPGCAVDQDREKCEHLALISPRRSIYLGDTLDVLPRLLEAHPEANFLDLDAYGDPWAALTAACSSKSLKGAAVVITDGLQQTLNRNLRSSQSPALIRMSELAGGFLKLRQDYESSARLFADEICGGIHSWTSYAVGDRRTGMRHHAFIVKPDTR